MRFSILVLHDMRTATIRGRFQSPMAVARAVMRLEADGTLRRIGYLRTLDHDVTIMSTPGSWRTMEEYTK